MSNYQPTQQQVNHFWDRFLQRAYEQGVTKPTDRWYVIRAEEYIKAFPGKRLADHRATNVNGYLEELGRKTNLEDWQFGQAVDAIKILFSLVQAEWVDQVDRAGWKASSQSLANDHPSIARDVSTAGSTRTRTKRLSLRSVRERHAVTLGALVAEIRRRAYSIRTEQAYESWVVLIHCVLWRH